MKKFIIGMTAITLGLCLTACGTAKNDTAITKLSNQLDDTSSTISSISTISPLQVDLTDLEDDLSDAGKETQQSLLNEQYYKAEILEKTAKIRSKLAGCNKLSTSQSSALNDLTSSLDKYTEMVKDSQTEMKGSARAIESLKKGRKNQDRLGAKLNRLSCNSNVRSAYYENLISTLSQIDNCLDIDENQTIQSKDVEDETKETETNTDRKHLKKNIDTYRSEREKKRKIPHNKFDEKNNIDTYGPNRRNIDSYRNPYGYGAAPYGNMPYAPYGNMPYGAYPNGRMNGYPNGVYGSNYYNRLNQNEEVLPVMTDKEDSTTKEAEKRLETYEKVLDDKGVVQDEKEENTAGELAVSASTSSVKRKHSLEERKDDPIAIAY